MSMSFYSTQIAKKTKLNSRLNSQNIASSNTGKEHMSHESRVKSPIETRLHPNPTPYKIAIMNHESRSDKIPMRLFMLFSSSY